MMQKMEQLTKSISERAVTCRIEGDRILPEMISDSVFEVAGLTREESERTLTTNITEMIEPVDRSRVLEAIRTAINLERDINEYFRVRQKDGGVVWLHFSGMVTGRDSFSGIVTRMSSENLLFQRIADETVDAIYVIKKGTDELLYANESEKFVKILAAAESGNISPHLWELPENIVDGMICETRPAHTEKVFQLRFKAMDWNGIPTYAEFVRDITEEVRTRKEKERLEQYFQTVLRYLPGGVAVIHMGKDGSMVPEFLSEGFLVMMGMTEEEAWQLYRDDAKAGVHPDDKAWVDQQMQEFLAGGESYCEMNYRLRRGDGGYLRVKNSFSIIENEGGEIIIYAGYNDVTAEWEERERLRRQYYELILQHYRAPEKNEILLGHCNITQNRILELVDRRNKVKVNKPARMREDFFHSLAGFIVEKAEREKFLNTFLNEPTLAAYNRGETELVQTCFVQLPEEENGRYVQIKVNMMQVPDSNDITGILTATDVTEQVISGLMLKQLSVGSYDLVMDVDLKKDRYTVVSGNLYDADRSVNRGSHSRRLEVILKERVLPKDRDQMSNMLSADYIYNRLRTEGTYSVYYSLIGEDGEILTKNLTVSSIDLRLGRVCFSRADITESVQEQQGMLSVIAYTFEILAFVRMDSRKMTMYTRQTILENLPPLVFDDFDDVFERVAKEYGQDNYEAAKQEFVLDKMIGQLSDNPEGYHFVLPYEREGEDRRYKQINVLWGDTTHSTVCMVRADVTDMLMAERQAQSTLEKALKMAEEANRAKSDFLSSMSHDIRTPMNAIMGMTNLALARLEEKGRVEDCLQKISLSSQHLLSLINDILDMSKIESSKVLLSHMEIYLPELLEQLFAIMQPQAKAGGLKLDIQTQEVCQRRFYGDSLRINQILINVLGNAIKFTPEGGRVSFHVEQSQPIREASNIRYRFTISDTGVGMSEEFTKHIFEPFTRSQNAERIEGTGLGLSITKGLVDLMEGSISVESCLGEGTVFVVELEFEAVKECENMRERESAEGRIAADADFTGYCFLVAEDNDINAEILCELLKMKGAEFVVKKDGALAVAAFREAPVGTYDAILMDIQMPNMNGYEATKEIRRMDREDAHGIPIIALTANAFAEDIQASMMAGMNEHVVKPIDAKILYAVLCRELHL